MRGHEIELLSEIGQGGLALDAADYAPHPEQFRGGAEKRLAVCVEPKGIVSEVFADVEKIAGTRAEIENAQWLRAVEPKVLGAFYVDVDPINDVFETIDLRRTGPIRIFVAQISKLQPIDVVQNAVFVDRMGQPADVLRRAGEYFAGKQLVELA